MPKNRKFSHCSYSHIDNPSVVGQRSAMFVEALNISVKNHNGTIVAVTDKKKLKALSKNKAVIDQLFYYLYEDKDSEFGDFIGSFIHLGAGLATINFLIEKGKDGDIILTRTTTRSIVSGPINAEITILDQGANFYSKSTRIHISPVKGTAESMRVTVEIQSIETVNMECLDEQKTKYVKELGGKEQCANKINFLKKKRMEADRFGGTEQKMVYVDKLDAQGIYEHKIATVDCSDPITQKVLYVYACDAVESYANKNMFPDEKYVQGLKKLFNLFGFDKNKLVTAIPFLKTRNTKELYDLFKDYKSSELFIIKNIINKLGNGDQSYLDLEKNIDALINAKKQIDIIKSYLSSCYLFGGNISRFFSKVKTSALTKRFEGALLVLDNMVKGEVTKNFLSSILKDNFNTYQLIQIYQKIPFDFSENIQYEAVRNIIGTILKEKIDEKRYLALIQATPANTATAADNTKSGPGQTTSANCVIATVNDEFAAGAEDEESQQTDTFYADYFKP